uniref:Uncharacterized protein n=1 Tax=Micrurus spixii TaxID=129469 RepID=A0A2D4LH20_9SAUR
MKYFFHVQRDYLNAGVENDVKTVIPKEGLFENIFLFTFSTKICKIRVLIPTKNIIYYVKPFNIAVQLVMHLQFSVAAVQCLYQSNFKKQYTNLSAKSWIAFRQVSLVHGLLLTFKDQLKSALFVIIP